MERTLAKLRNIKINIDLVPTKNSVKNLEKSFKNINKDMTKTFDVGTKKQEKMLKEQAKQEKSKGKMSGMIKTGLAVGAGMLAGGVIGMLKDAVTKPLTTLDNLIAKSEGIANKGASTGLSGSRQLNLDKFLAQAGLGGEIGTQIQEKFKSSDKLGSLFKSGLLGQSMDFDKMLANFLNQAKSNPRLLKEILGTDLANITTRNIGGAGDLSKIATQVGLGKENQAQDISVRAGIKAKNIGEVQRTSMEYAKLGQLGAGSIEKINKLKETQLQKDFKGLENIDALINAVTGVQETLSAVEGGLQKVISFLTDFATGKFNFGKIISDGIKNGLKGLKFW